MAAGTVIALCVRPVPAMQTVHCDDSHRDAWNAFVDRHATLYHRYEWSYVNRFCFGHASCYLAAIDSGQIVGILPLVRVKSRLFGNIACSLPYVNYGGPASIEDDIDRLLLIRAAEVADDWNVDYVEIRSRKRLAADLPTSEHKVSMTVDLHAGADALWQGFSHSHRKDIRRGYKNGFDASTAGPALVDEFYSVLQEAWRDMGTPIYSKRYFETVVTTFHHLVRICVVRRADRPVAASLQAHDHGVGEGLWLGARAEARHDHAGYVLYWELLKDAACHGCHTFHLGRSTARSAAETYKRKWNAELTQLYWHYVLRHRSEIPQLNPSNRKYQVALTVWRHLPVSVASSLGRIVAPTIP